MRHNLVSTTIVLLLAIFGCGTSHAQTLVIWQKDGSKVYYSLDEQPKTTFTPKELVLTTRKTTINYPLSKILRYTYEGGMQGIEDVKSQNICISHRGDEIIVTGLPQGRFIAVYSVDGKKLLSKYSNGSICQTFSLSQFPAGVYVIKADTVTYKITKR